MTIDKIGDNLPKMVAAGETVSVSERVTIDAELLAAALALKMCRSIPVRRHRWQIEGRLGNVGPWTYCLGHVIDQLCVHQRLHRSGQRALYHRGGRA